MNPAAALLAAVEIGDPLTRGSLALFPLFHERPPTGAYLSGPRAHEHLHIAELAEGATVPELEVANGWPVAVLLLDGETLLGAQQNRILTTSVLVPAAATTRVSVTCVEAGRWGGDERPVARSGRHAPSAVRARNLASVTRSVVEGGCVQPDQAGVWNEIDRYLTAARTDSPTRALEDVPTDHVHEIVGGTTPLAGQCGVAAAVGGRVVAVDLFDDPRTLADYWDALVAGYTLDAKRTPTKHPRRRDVRRVLANVAAGRATSHGGRVHIDAGNAAATAVVLDDIVVHLVCTNV